MTKRQGVIIGLTGPTGAGKGEMARILLQRGIPVVDTDRLAREVTAPKHPCLAELVDAFSSDILCEDGTLNRVVLAMLAFSSPEKTALLNSITHPHIIQRTKELLNKYFAAGAEIAVIDAPLLFESGMQTLCDRTIAVLAPAPVRCTRICERDDLSKEQAALRMQAQPQDEFYEAHADDILLNDGTLEAFTAQVDAWIDTIKAGRYET